MPTWPALARAPSPPRAGPVLSARGWGPIGILPVVALPIEIFRAGKHTAMNGETIEFTDRDLEQIAKAYNPKVHEAPIVLGHPAHDAPAYGWAKSLAFVDGRLSASCDQVDAAFADAVGAGKFKKVSASFYKPDSANNPTPGQYYLRHIGFLGAMPPAVKGLREAQFAGGQEDCFTVVDFGELDVANLLRSLREFLIAEFGIEKADKAMPPWDVTYAQNSAAVEAASEVPAYAEGEAPPADAAAADSAVSELEKALSEALLPAATTALTEGLAAAFPDLQADAVKAAVDAALAKVFKPGEGDAASPFATAVKEGVAKLVKAAPAAPAPAAADDGSVSHGEPTKTKRELELEAELRREREANAKRVRGDRREAHVSFLDGLVREGRRMPVKRELLLDFLELAAASDASFGDEAAAVTPIVIAKQLLQRLPKEVDFGEHGGGELGFSEDADPAAVARAAQAYQDEQQRKGVRVSTSEAVNHVKGKR